MKKWFSVLPGLLVIGMIFTSGCKKSYNITGNWSLTLKSGSVTVICNITFTGGKAAGTFTLIPKNQPFSQVKGTYEVDGSRVTFEGSGQMQPTNNIFTQEYSGNFNSDDQMSGTGIEITPLGSATFNWTAER